MSMHTATPTLDEEQGYWVTVTAADKRHLFSRIAVGLVQYRGTYPKQGATSPLPQDASALPESVFEVLRANGYDCICGPISDTESVVG